jgi:hypothetical protein
MPVLELDLAPDDAKVRRFAYLWLPVFAALFGVLVLLRGGRLRDALVVWCAGLVVSVLARLHPLAPHLLYRGTLRLTYPVGWVVSHLLLLGVFYLVLTPLGGLLRLLGRDMLGCNLERRASTYWSPHVEAPGRRSYFRQF